jgi:maltokinase
MAVMTFEENLASWLPGQRWFAGKGTPITGLAVVSRTTLVAGDPGLRHLIVAVTQDSGTDWYQLFLGLRADLPDTLEHVRIGPAEPGLIGYDGLHDPGLTAVLLEAMAGQASIGPVHFARRPGGHIDTGLESLVLTAEQSNTSLLFGEEAILKVFRRLSPGPNPDLEVPEALARLGSRHVAAPQGWITTEAQGVPTVLAVLSAYLRNAVDGWSLAATSVRDLYASATAEAAPASAEAAQAGGDFSGEAHRLGEATAEVHRDLATAFGSRELPARAYREMSAQMLDRLDRAVAAVPQLARHDRALRAAFEEVATLSDPLEVQRIHGDYHLGQVMRTHAGWVLLDFEGEPAVPLERRRACFPALRDVAGMLRSLDYAARFQLAGNDNAGLIAVARDWARRNQAAFCAGYARAGGADPGKHGILVRALTLDKAVYEVIYEARNRPSWLPIPLGSIADGAA